ncbi:50S ribosomal protein L10, partial [uncultured Proteiniphilum sp.]|uniref:50S ribosomal protein L10 n=1 Tax=uncultured Proteiniphilum sp. TaxID=497637 RepID=UPI0026224ACA
ECFLQQGIKLVVVKNTLLQKAFESLERDYTDLYPVLKGNTAIMFSNVANTPAKLIDKYKADKVPAFKGAYVQESFFVGEKALQDLVNIKSKTELIGDVIALLQSPAKNVISALQSGGTILHGVLKTLSEKES